jgi:cell division ATPase FtsA
MLSCGGNDITDSISKNLDLPWELAEEVKKSSLILSAPDSKYSETVVIRRGGSYKTLERRSIFESVKPKTEEFLNKIKDAIDSSVWKDKMDCGMVCVGGMSNLEGMLERIESQTGMLVRLGHVNSALSKSDISAPQYAAAVGLINYCSISNNIPNLKNYFIGKTTLNKAISFVRNIYQEYF